MIKEAKDIDFYTSGRQPSEQDFARISEWISKQKEEKPFPKVKKNLKQLSQTHTGNLLVKE